MRNAYLVFITTLRKILLQYFCFQKFFFLSDLISLNFVALNKLCWLCPVWDNFVRCFPLHKCLCGEGNFYSSRLCPSGHCTLRKLPLLKCVSGCQVSNILSLCFLWLCLPPFFSLFSFNIFPFFY